MSDVCGVPSCGCVGMPVVWVWVCLSCVCVCACILVCVEVASVLVYDCSSVGVFVYVSKNM